MAFSRYLSSSFGAGQSVRKCLLSHSPAVRGQEVLPFTAFRVLPLAPGRMTF